MNYLDGKRLTDTQIKYLVGIMRKIKNQQMCLQMFKNKFKRSVSRETARKVARDNKITFQNGKNKLDNEKLNFIDSSIRKSVPQAQILRDFRNKFGVNTTKDTLRNRAEKLNLKFQKTYDRQYSEKELSIFKGAALVNDSYARIKEELKHRTSTAILSKMKALKRDGTMNEDIRNQIGSDIRAGKSDKYVSEKYGIHPKYIYRFRTGVIETSDVEVKNLKRWEESDVNDVLDLIESAQEKLLSLDTEQEEANIKITTANKYVALTFISDIHLENVNTDIRQLRADINTIVKTPDFYVGFGGDLIDNFMVGPHKEGMVEAVVQPKAARIAAGKLFDFLKGRLLWSILGCHDAWDANYADYNLPEHIARKLRVPYLGHGGDVNLTLQKRGSKQPVVYNIHARHKFKGGSSGNGTAVCKKVLTEIDSKYDIVAISHNHFAEIKLEHYLRKQRCFIRTGSYKREDRYSKQLGYQGNDFNSMIPVVLLNTQTKEMKVVSGISNAAELLRALNK